MKGKVAYCVGIEITANTLHKVRVFQTSVESKHECKVLVDEVEVTTVGNRKPSVLHGVDVYVPDNDKPPFTGYLKITGTLLRWGIDNDFFFFKLLVTRHHGDLSFYVPNRRRQRR